MPESADAACFDALYAAEQRAVFAFLLGHCGDRDTAADLLQQTFLRAWEHIAEVRSVPEERRRFWLLAVARNLLRDHSRRRIARERAEAELSAQAQARQAASGVERAVIARRMAAAVDEAVACLPDDLRLVLSLRLLAEMTSAEIGAALGRPAGTIRYQLSRARARIAQRLGLSEEEACGN